MGQRLLIVDSDRRFIQDHRTALEATFEVEVLYSIETALTRLETGLFAAVLLCVEVSENKGYSLCSAIRKAPALQDLKVALISGKATAEEYARHQTLKGRADLYLHKPIQTSALLAALTPIVPLKLEDPDNPLGDLGVDLGDEWLESLKTELEVDTPARPEPPVAPSPATVTFQLPPLPLSHQATQRLTVVPMVAKDAGRVELLEARVEDLEAKLVAKADELDRNLQELAELRHHHNSITRNLDDLEQRQAQAELLHAKLRESQEALTAQAAQGEATAQALRTELDAALAEREQLREQQALSAAGHEAVLQALRTELEAAQVERQRLLEEQQRLATQSDATTQALRAELEAAQAERQRLLEQQQLLATQSDDTTQALRVDLAAALAEGQRLLEQGEANANRLAETAQQTMEITEANQLLQAQLEEARENAGLLLQSERALQDAQARGLQLERDLDAREAACQELQERCAQQEAAIQSLRSDCEECSTTRTSLETAFANLEQQVATMGANHEQQQLELLAGIDEREALVGRLNANLDAMRDSAVRLEQQKAALEGRAQDHASQLSTLAEALVELEARAAQALALARTASH